MGREIRRVPANWEHPKDSKGNYIPLLDSKYSKVSKEWYDEKCMWKDGFCKNYVTDEWEDIEEAYKHMTYIEYAGERPKKEDYMPEWSEYEKTHIQMYEDCTEGTPISPVMKTPEELARWLTDNKASAFANQTATYEEWLNLCKSGYAPSMVISSEGIQSGVSFMNKREKEGK